MIPITCQSCGYANEPTRVFCHQCGVRLEKPTATAVAPAPAPTPAAVKSARSKLKKTVAGKKPIFDPVSIVFSLLSTTLFSALLAAIILSIRPPANLPAPGEASTAQTLAIQQRFDEATDPNSPSRQFIATSAELSSLLATRVSIQQTAASSVVSTESHPFFALENQSFVLGMQIRLSKLEIVSQRRYRVTGSPGHLTLQAVNNQIGSLPLPGFLADLLMGWTKGVGDAFSKQLDQIQTADSVLIGTGNVQIVWKSDQ